ncbi:DUF7350 domain-containing protein [Halovenus sp. HT40]|uniref:DUF7350 domain-containing protein n=1 Tax=Halovenus sp. HT40 TaxID=3126691 RepID=UPI00300F2BD6
MRRRVFLEIGGAAGLASLAGCLSAGSPSPEVEPGPPWRRDGEVYHTGHDGGMEMIGFAQSGSLTVGLSYAFPTQFWTVAGSRRNRIDLTDRNDAVHIMASVWDTDTETVFPIASGLRVSVERDGSSPIQKALWPMLSQKMGFHFGDNFTLEEWGEHTITVDIGSPSLQKRGGLQGSFEGIDSVSFEYNFQLSKRNYNISGTEKINKRGTHAAVPPMQMSRHPLSFAPRPSEIPGRLLGRATSGDADFLVFADDSSLVVSPRTPFNRFVLPLMSLSARIERDGQTVTEGSLTPTIDPSRDYHYRRPIDGVETGDTITISIDAPPQTARHAGYESAFLEMSDVTITV